MLPIELYLQIFKFLDINTLLTVAMSNSVFFNLIHIKPNNLPTKLRKASELGNLEAFKYFKLKEPNKFEKCIKRDQWIIHYSIQYFNHNITDYLLQFKPLLHPMSLNLSISRNNYRLFNKLITYGCNPNNKTLDLACKQNNSQYIQLLLNNGELFNQRHIFIAIVYGYSNIVQLLINNNVKCNFESANLAYLHNRQDILQILLKKGIHNSTNKYLNKHRNKYHSLTKNITK